MKVSARNVFEGTVSKLTGGEVNTEVVVLTAGGDSLVAVVTRNSAEELGLAIGKPVIAFVKAPWVMMLTGVDGDGLQIRFSARNQLAGVVEAVDHGAVNCEVSLRLPGGSVVQAVLTREAVLELGLKPGVQATALIKASHVILGVPA